MENEQEETTQEEVETNDNVYYPARKLTVAMNIEKFNEATEGAKVLSSFINILEGKIGVLDLDLSVSINPYLDKKDNKSIGYDITTDAYGQNVEVENEFDYDDEDEPEERIVIK